MAHKKAGGSSRNGRDTKGRRLGVKKFGGEAVHPRQHHRPPARHQALAGRRRRSRPRPHDLRRRRGQGDLPHRLQGPDLRLGSPAGRGRGVTHAVRQELAQEAGGSAGLLPFLPRISGMSETIVQQSDIETERLRLRRFRRSDAALIELYASDRRVAWMTERVPASLSAGARRQPSSSASPPAPPTRSAGRSTSARRPRTA